MTFAALALAFASWSASTPPSPPLPAPASPPLVVDVAAVVRPTARALEAAAVEAGRKTYQMRCQGCHGAMHQKYDLLVDKGFTQRELMSKMVYLPKIHPAHQKYRSDYF